MRSAILITVMLSGCCDAVTSYCRNFPNRTFYRIDKKKATRTGGGILVVGTRSYVLLDRIDRKTDELERCLGKTIDLKKFGVFIPPDWYTSKCSGEQLVPSRIDFAGCAEKGVKLPKACQDTDLMKPTKECPCVCNVRAKVQDDWWIVTAPNLKLYKAELTRLVTGIYDPWRAGSEILKCLK